MARHWEWFPTFDNWAIKYSIWLQEKWWVIKPVLEEEWNILTNISWMIVERVDKIF